MSANALPQLNLSHGNPVDLWEQWINRFRIYLTATEVDKKSEKIQVAQLLHFAGPEIQKIYSTLQFDEEEADKLKPVIDKLNSYFKPRENLNFLRYQFFTSRQGELSTEQFVTELKKRASVCKFDKLTDDLILCVLISATNNSEVREKLLQKEDLSLNEAVKWCNIIEQAKMQTKRIENINNQVGDEISAVRIQSRQTPSRRHTSRRGSSKSRSQSRHTAQPQEIRSDRNFIYNCSRCGLPSHPINKCPAFAKTCGKCQKRNHFASVCKTNRDKRINSVNSRDSLDLGNETLYIGTINNIKSRITDTEYTAWHTKLEINNNCLDFKIDTGAPVNIISISDYINVLKLPVDLLQSTQIQLKSYTGDKIPLVGMCQLKCKKNNSLHDIVFHVVNNTTEALLGLPACVELNLVQNLELQQSTSSCLSSISSQEDRIKNVVAKEFGDVFSGIGEINPPYHITTCPDVQPVISPIRKVPFALIDKLKETLQDLEKSKIIEKVNGPSEWVNPLVIVKKPDNTLRICLDPFHLNKAIKREHCKIDSFEEITGRMAGAKIFTKLDANQAFYMVPLDEPSSKLCTFGTPFGRYKFKRLPYGVSCAPEVFYNRFRSIFSFNNVGTYIDDIILWGKNQKEHDETLRKVLIAAREHGVKFKLTKCQFSVNETNFMGHVINEHGITIDENRLKAITEIPSPTCKKDVQRLIGIINYVGKYIPNYSVQIEPLRTLLKKDVVFQWEEPQIKALEEIKQSLTQKPVLQFFDPKKEVTVSVDSSQSGIGACLMQENKPISYASKSLTEAQTRYSQIEKEMLAVLFGLNKFHEFVFLHKSLVVETDHKPLISIVRKPINKCPARLQRILLQLIKYQFTLKYKRGSELVIADALSRAYLPDQQNSEEISEIICVVNSGPHISDEMSEKIRRETANDKTLQLLYDTIVRGWPNHNKVHDSIKIYCKYKSDLVVDNGIIYKGIACLVPHALRSEILRKIHYAHLGISKCIQLAEESVFWPTLRNELKQLIETCTLCNKYAASQVKQPLRSHEIVTVPWYKVGSDVFELHGKQYLLIVDYYSKYIEVKDLNGYATSGKIINTMKEVFATFGVPAIVVTDGASPYTSSFFQEFAKSWSFKHVVTSPYNSQSNGLAERHIQTVKKMFKKVLEDKRDIYLALLQWRNTPIFESATPNQLLMSRSTRCPLLPLDINKLRPHIVNPGKYERHLRQNQHKSAEYYNSKGVRELKPLKINSNVWVKLKPDSNWQPGKIISKVDDRRYKVILENKGEYIRNRKFIRQSALANNQGQQNNYIYPEKRVRWKDKYDCVYNSQGNRCVDTNSDSECTVNLDPINNLLNNNQNEVNKDDSSDNRPSTPDSNSSQNTNIAKNDFVSPSCSKMIVNSGFVTHKGRLSKPPERFKAD